MPVIDSLLTRWETFESRDQIDETPEETLKRRNRAMLRNFAQKKKKKKKQNVQTRRREFDVSVKKKKKKIFQHVNCITNDQFIFRISSSTIVYTVCTQRPIPKANLYLYCEYVNLDNTLRSIQSNVVCSFSIFFSFFYFILKREEKHPKRREW